MAIVLYLIPATTTLLTTISKTVVGFALYVGLLLLIDAQARGLLLLIWKEISVTLKQLIHRADVLGEPSFGTSEN